MSLSYFAHEDLAFVSVQTYEPGLPLGEPTRSWDSFTCEIRRLFKVAIASSGEVDADRGRVVIAAERILDAIASMAIEAETMADDRRARLTFSLEQCESEAQRLFDAYMDGQPAAVLSAYAERGLISAYGLMDMFVAVSH